MLPEPQITEDIISYYVEHDAELRRAHDFSEAPRALVTGAASGIGAACALQLLSRGYYVTGMDLRNGALPLQWCIGSVVEPKHCDRAVEVAEPAVLVHCAGIGAGTLGLAHTHEMSEAQWENVIHVNLTGSWNIAKACLAHGIESMLFISSISGLVNAGRGARNVNYAASKAGVIGMVRSLAVEYAPEVRVNVLCPGATDTPMYERGVAASPLMMERFIREHPMGRPSTSAEIADIAVAVALNTAMTGSLVVCDGGYTAA